MYNMFIQDATEYICARCGATMHGRALFEIHMEKSHGENIRPTVTYYSYGEEKMKRRIRKLEAALRELKPDHKLLEGE